MIETERNLFVVVLSFDVIGDVCDLVGGLEHLRAELVRLGWHSETGQRQRQRLRRRRQCTRLHHRRLERVGSPGQLLDAIVARSALAISSECWRTKCKRAVAFRRHVVVIVVVVVVVVVVCVRIELVVC